MLLRNIGRIVVKVSEVLLLGKWRLAKMIIGSDAAVVSDLGEFPDIMEVIAADVDINEDGITITELALD